MKSINEVEVGKLLHGLFLCSDYVIKSLNEKKYALETSMYEVRGVNYSKMKSGSVNSENRVLRQIEKKDRIERYLQLMNNLQEVVIELLVLMEDEELTPYMLKGKKHIDINKIMDECSLSERTAYRKVDSWYGMLGANLINGK